MRAMPRRDLRITALVGLTPAALLGVPATLASQIGRPYPGFFFSPDCRVFPVTAAARAAYLLYVERACRGRQRSRWALLAVPGSLDMVWGRPYKRNTRLTP